MLPVNDISVSILFIGGVFWIVGDFLSRNQSKSHIKSIKGAKIIAGTICKRSMNGRVIHEIISAM